MVGTLDEFPIGFVGFFFSGGGGLQRAGRLGFSGSSWWVPLKFPHSLVNGEIGRGFLFFWGSVQDQDKDYRLYDLSNSRDFNTLGSFCFLEMVDLDYFGQGERCFQ